MWMGDIVETNRSLRRRVYRSTENGVQLVAVIEPRDLAQLKLEGDETGPECLEEGTEGWMKYIYIRSPPGGRDP